MLSGLLGLKYYKNVHPEKAYNSFTESSYNGLCRMDIADNSLQALQTLLVCINFIAIKHSWLRCPQPFSTNWSKKLILICWGDYLQWTMPQVAVWMGKQYLLISSTNSTMLSRSLRTRRDLKQPANTKPCRHVVRKWKNEPRRVHYSQVQHMRHLSKLATF